jgi:hypothetical protein
LADNLINQRRKEMTLGCPSCGSLTTHKHEADCRWSERTSGGMTPIKAVEFLREAAGYFERRPTNGEDAAHWSNIANAASCRRIAEMIEGSKDRIAPVKPQNFS